MLKAFKLCIVPAQYQGMTRLAPFSQRAAGARSGAKRNPLCRTICAALIETRIGLECFKHSSFDGGDETDTAPWSVPGGQGRSVAVVVLQSRAGALHTRTGAIEFSRPMNAETRD